MTSPKRISSLHVEKVITRLADQYLPLGIDLTDNARRLLRREIECAQFATAPTSQPLKSLRDVVALFARSQCRSVQEFAQYCKIEDADDLLLESSVFLQTKELASPVEGACSLLGEGFFVLLSGVRYPLRILTVFAVGWLLVICMPILFAICSPSIETTHLAQHLDQAMALCASRWHFFYDLQLIQFTVIYSVVAGGVWFAFGRRSLS